MKLNTKGIRFSDLTKVCDYYIGKAKHYQVKQVLEAFERLESNNA